jgi:hypothetical protein
MHSLLSLLAAETAYGLPEESALRVAVDKYIAERGHSREIICTGLGTCPACRDLQALTHEETSKHA